MIFKKEENKQHVGIAFACFLFTIGLSFLSAYVFQQLWGWFLVPLGGILEITIHPIGYLQAYGLGVIFVFVKKNSMAMVVQHEFAKKHIENYAINVCCNFAFNILFSWGMGAIVHACIS